MAPDLILVVAGLSAAWAFFSIIGGERQRVLQNAELSRRAAGGAAETQSPDVPTAVSATAPKPSR